jgi:hypothetical protein
MSSAWAMVKLGDLLKRLAFWLARASGVGSQST